MYDKEFSSNFLIKIALENASFVYIYAERWLTFWLLCIVGPVTKEFGDEHVYLNRSTDEGRIASDEAWKALIPSKHIPPQYLILLIRHNFFHPLLETD